MKLLLPLVVLLLVGCDRPWITWTLVEETPTTCTYAHHDNGFATEESTRFARYDKPSLTTANRCPSPGGSISDLTAPNITPPQVAQ